MDLSERGSGTARHPWEIERFRAYRAILAQHAALHARRVLDVGAGDGWFSETLLADLPEAERVVQWDSNYDAADLEPADRDARLVRVAEAPQPGYDLVLALDVLEHIDEPRRFIDEQLRPLTGPGTAVLVAVPAHPWLFSEHDRALGHHRRYTAERLLEEVGGWITVVDHGPLFTTLVAPRAAGVAWERLRARTARHASAPTATNATHGVGEWHAGQATTRVARTLLAADAAATRKLGRAARRLPGLSHWAFGYTT